MDLLAHPIISSAAAQITTDSFHLKARPITLNANAGVVPALMSFGAIERSRGTIMCPTVRAQAARPASWVLITFFMGHVERGGEACGHCVSLVTLTGGGTLVVGLFCF